MPKDKRVVGLRTFDSPLRVYGEAIPYSDPLFQKHNAFPNAGFEQPVPGQPVGDRARTGRYALEVRHEAVARTGAVGALTRTMDSSPFLLPPDTGYVFGGFLMKTGGTCESLRMEIRSGLPDVRQMPRQQAVDCPFCRREGHREHAQTPGELMSELAALRGAGVDGAPWGA